MRDDKQWVLASFTLPSWLVPRKLYKDLESRSSVTGTASVSKSWLKGLFSIEATMERPRNE